MPLLSCFYTTNYIIRPYSALYHKLYTQSNAPEDGRNYRPKHVELIEIINKIIIVASNWLFILYLRGVFDVYPNSRI